MDALNDAFATCSRVVHPDQFAGASAQIRARARTHMSLLNEAHHVLKDPLHRAGYLAMLGGFDINRPGEPGGAPTPSQGFLMEMLARRDAAETITTVEDRERLLDEVMDERAQAFAGAVACLEREAFEDAARDLIVVRYLDRFIESLEEALDSE